MARKKYRWSIYTRFRPNGNEQFECKGKTKVRGRRKFATLQTLWKYPFEVVLYMHEI